MFRIKVMYNFKDEDFDGSSLLVSTNDLKKALKILYSQLLKREIEEFKAILTFVR